MEASRRRRGARILVVGLRGIPGIMGGVESHCEQLFPRLKALCERYEIVLVGRRAYVSSSPFDYLGIKVVPLPASRSRYFEAFSNSLIAVLYGRFIFGADLLHIHAIGPALLGPLARALGMKLIVTHHGADYRRAKWNRFARMMLRLGEWCAITVSNKVIVVSSSLTEELRERYPTHRAKIEHIPNGATNLVPAGSEVPSGDEILGRYGLTKNQYIIAVGRLVPEKGFHDLVAAFKDVNNDLQLVIVGSADHQDEYSQSLVRQASDRIVFTGFQTRDALRVLYKYASLFVLPSHHEGLPIAALEAAILGAPVLLSDIRPNRDIGLEAMNYFPVGDIGALRQKMLETHSSFRTDPEAIARRFDWDAIAKATAEIYSAVLARGSPPTDRHSR